MYLKSLELFGFKSFAPKTVMNFHRGVTCVVGPNGCGKSNVLDAIRWVLGEQSAKALRGGEMADVIFSGTDSRPALGMAEVAMTFAECEQELGLDWNEVTIARRVYRDGGSEYFLNKTPCRLRDIHQLFMDTGIGRSAYSIMEQGKIDAILSSKPEDRRAIFEEAAGITKFKAQKREALRKLEGTDANLLRLDDIIKEVKRQIGSLQRQAGKARRYQALMTDLRTLETHHARRQWEGLEAQRTQASGELNTLTERQAQTEAQIEQQEAEAAAHRSALGVMEQQLELARRAVNELRARISNHEGRLTFNGERVAELGGLVERYRGEVSGAQEKRGQAQVQLHETDRLLEEITTMLASELRRLEEKQAAMASSAAERQAAERSLGLLAGELQRLEHKVGSLRGQLSSISQQREGAQARLGVLSSDLLTAGESWQERESEKAAAQDELARAEEALQAVGARVQSGEGEHREAQSALAAADQEARGVQRTLSDKESKLEVLRALIASGEGFSKGTQAVLKGLDNPEFFKPAVQGALGQFIQVAPEYVAAVEAALGANVETVVMKDTAVAEAVIKTLTAQKLGKASLALRDLDASFQHVESGELKLPEGALDWLINKITPAPEMQRLVERLINHTVLVPDLETALRLFPQRGSAIVTLQGEVLTGTGILYGGAQAQAANSLLERKNQVAALEREVSAAQAQVQQMNEQRAVIVARIEAAHRALEEAREERQSASLAVSTLRGQLGQMERELAEALKRRQNLEWERGNSEARLREAEEKMVGLEESLRAAQEQSETLLAQRAEAQHSLETLRVRESELSGELNELKIRVATERQRHTSLHHQREPMEARLTELAELIVQRGRDVESYTQRIAATEAESAELEASLGGLREQSATAELEVARQMDERAMAVAAAEEAESTLRGQRQQLSAFHDQRSRLEVRLSQLEMKTTALLERVQRRYQLALPEFQRDLHALRVSVREAQKRSRNNANGEGGETPAATEPELVESTTPDSALEAETTEAFEVDWTRVEQLVAELNQRLDSMGPVNVDAIQEYDELEERFAFLEKQNRDLQSAKEELLQVIQKINRTTRELFADTFEKVRVNFGEMFTELFGGGKANLILTDESDPLESGIEIIARPPGKQLSAITLLSGGERTMTAVALLFAIYMVKPSPFCVLDEMDAPLDESNISRFIRILDRFVDQSQFVVISHHKRTIARADALYGVTMEEHGVSKLVGVRFAKRDESHESSDIIGTANGSPVPSVAETFGKRGELHSEAVHAG